MWKFPSLVYSKSGFLNVVLLLVSRKFRSLPYFLQWYSNFFFFCHLLILEIQKDSILFTLTAHNRNGLELGPEYVGVPTLNVLFVLFCLFIISVMMSLLMIYIGNVNFAFHNIGFVTSWHCFIRWKNSFIS